MSQDLPKRTPHEPPIAGPHEVVGEPGVTHHYVFGGPNARTRDGQPAAQPITQADLAPLAASLTAPARPRWQRILLATLEWVAAVVAFVAFALLTMAWDSLNTGARIATTGVILVAVAAYWTGLHARRRRARKT